MPINHPLEADCHHAFERMNQDRYGKHAAAARAHARQAGREAALQNLGLEVVSPHIENVRILHTEYEHAFAEVERLHISALPPIAFQEQFDALSQQDLSIIASANEIEA